ncbi:stage II sporulation protein M, partial [Spirillospora sp. NPDC049652]
MDVDAYVAAHNAEWQRLEKLINSSRKRTGAEIDELVELYQRTATHLSAIRSSAPDPALVARLSSLVAR